MQSLLAEIIAEAEADAACVGVVVIGSYAAGTADAESDLDVLYVVRGRGGGGRERRGKVELIRTTLERFADPPEWFKPALAHAYVPLDKTGDVAAAVAAAASVTREETAELYDSYLNDFYRSLKAWRRRNELAARLEAARSLRFLCEFLFALDGRRAPYPIGFAGRLGELEPLILAVARSADPRAQQELQARVAAVASGRGFRDVYDGWDGEIDRVMRFEF